MATTFLSVDGVLAGRGRALGIFGRRKSDSVTSAGVGRDIPRLDPVWFEEQLVRAGKPVTAHNKAAVAELTSVNLALNAERWLGVVGTPEVRGRWDNQFGHADEDLSAMMARPDMMIDFLWAVSPRLYPGLRDFVAGMGDTFQSAARSFGAQLPLDMWSVRE